MCNNFKLAGKRNISHSPFHRNSLFSISFWIILIQIISEVNRRQAVSNGSSHSIVKLSDAKFLRPQCPILTKQSKNKLSRFFFVAIAHFMCRAHAQPFVFPTEHKSVPKRPETSSQLPPAFSFNIFRRENVFMLKHLCFREFLLLIFCPEMLSLSNVAFNPTQKLSSGLIPSFIIHHLTVSLVDILY